MKRQKIRKLMLLISFLLFPVTIYYFSPALIIAGALESVITGSFITFGLMSILALFWGRAFCGYACPAGAIQEAAFGFKDKKAKTGKRDYIKYCIWVVWISAIIASFAVSGGIEKIDALYMTDHGISISNIYAYIIYYSIVCLILAPSLIFGKRAFCHYLCWMAPFMVIGTEIRNALRLPGLRLAADRSLCNSCGMCSRSCTMGLDVAVMVQKERCYDSECILCGVCIDTCPKHALKYAFKEDRQNQASRGKEVHHGQ